MENWNKEAKGYQAGLRRILAGILAAVLIFGNVSPGLPYAFAEETDAEVYIESYAEAEETESEEESEETSEEISEEPTETATEKTSEEETSEEITEEASTEDISEEDTSEEASSEEETSEEELSIEPADELAEEPDLEADVEDESDWELFRVASAFPRKALLTVAEGQLGYQESTKNYEVDEDGIRHGYTRYGAYCGDPYGAWNTYFALFCVHYAGVDSGTEALPTASNCADWVDALGDRFVSAGAADESEPVAKDAYIPSAGELVFWDTDGDGEADRVGIITSTEDGITAACGDVNGYAEEADIPAEQIVGYGKIEDTLSEIGSGTCSTETNAKWTLYNNGHLVIEPIDPTKEYYVCSSAFSKRIDIKSVEFLNRSLLVSIGAYAFNGAGNLETVDLSNCTNLKTIESSAWPNGVFGNTPALKTVNLSGCSSLETIGDRAFLRSAVQNINFTGCSSLRTIGFAVFYEAPYLEELDLGDSRKMESVGAWFLYGTQSLKEVILCSDKEITTTFNVEQSFGAFFRAGYGGTGFKLDVSGCEGDLIFKGEAFKESSLIEFNASGSGVRNIRTSMFNGCGTLETVDLSNCTNLKTIESTAWPNGAFGNTPTLKTVNLSGCSSLETIGDRAFLRSAVQNINFTGCSSLRTIGFAVFYEAPYLEELNLSDSRKLESVGAWLLEGTQSLQKVILCSDAGTKTAFNKVDGKSTFYGAGTGGSGYVLDVTGCKGDLVFQTSEFSNSNIVEFNAGGSGISKISNNMFAGCGSLESVNLSGCSSLETIGDKAFLNSSVQTINFTGCSSLRTIGGSAFESSGIQSINLTECINLRTIGGGAFFQAPNLTELNLSDSRKLEWVGAWFLFGTKSLTKVTLCSDKEITTTFNAQQHMYFNYGAFYGAGLGGTGLKLDVSGCEGDLIFIGDAFRDSMLTEFDASGSGIRNIPTSLFAGCGFLETVNLSNCKNIRKISDFVCRWQTALTEFNLSNSTVGYFGSYVVDGCSQLKEINIMDATICKFADNAFLYCTDMKVDLASAKAIGTIGANAFKGNTKFPSKLVLHNIQDLSYMDVDKDGNPVEITCPGTIGANAFEGINYLTEVDMRYSEDVVICSNAFKDDRNVHRLVIPVGLTDLADSAFQGCISVEELVWNAKNYPNTMSKETFSPGKSFASGYDLIIGSGVDNLPDEFFAGLTTHGDVYFEGVNQLEISASAVSGAPVPISNMNGTYYVDSYGVVYKVEDDQATLAYCPPDMTGYTVPTSLSTAGLKPDDSLKKTYTTIPVTQVADSAFVQARDLAAITFDDCSQITRVGAGAFYGVTALEEVFDNTSGLTAIKVSQAVKLFDPKAPVSAFTLTGLEQDIVDSGRPWEPGTAVTKIAGNDKNITLSISVDEGMAEYWNTDSQCYSMLTGEPFKAIVTAANSSAENQIGYVYLDISNSGLNGLRNFVLKDSNTGKEIGSVNVLQTNDPDIVCLKIIVPTGATGSFDLRPVYPSPNTPGGELRIWTEVPAELTKADAEPKDVPSPSVLDSEDPYIHIRWTVRRSQRSLGIYKSNEDNRNEGTTIGDGKGGQYASVNAMRWKITTPHEKLNTSFGLDLGWRYRYTDVITLPFATDWNATVLKALNDGNIRVYNNGAGGRSAYDIYAGMESPIIKLYQPQSASISNVTVVKTEAEGKTVLTLSWDINPLTANTETDATDFYIRIAPDALQVDLKAVAQMQGVSEVAEILYPVTLPDLTHTLSTDVFYTHSDTVHLEASVKEDIYLPGPIVSVGKARTNGADRMGISTPFQLVLRNDGTANTAAFTKLYDDMHTFLYITPSDMQEMFKAEWGERLTITISDAQGREWFEPVAVPDITGNNEKPAYKTNVNTAEEQPAALGTITIKLDSRNGDETTYLVSGTNTKGVSITEKYNSIEDGLNALGYVVTPEDHYRVDWTLSTDEDSLVWFGGMVRSTLVRASFKNTFQNLTRDMYHTYSSKNNWWIQFGNTAIANYAEQELKSGLTVTLREDVVFTMSLSRNGNAVGNIGLINFENGDLLGYNLSIANYGARIPNMPVTQTLTGSQVLLAHAEKNKGAAWTDGLDTVKVNGVDYYLLDSPGEYTNVYLGNLGQYCTASVVITPENNEFGNRTGQTTVLRWYIADMGSQNIAVQTMLLSDKIRYSFGSSAYMNDVVDDHLTASIGTGSGSVLRFQKEIVTANPNITGETTGEITDQDNFTVLTEDNHKVTYKLTLNYTGKTTYELNGQNVFDLLPQTFDVFEWNAENVQVAFRQEGDVVTSEALKEWYISKEAPLHYLNGNAQNTFIRWPEGAIATLNPGGALYIYVTLNYTDQWERYAGEANGAYISNTLYVDEIPDAVFHELRAIQRVLLQKGVHQINQIGPSLSKEYYNNVESHIEYYVTIYNGGVTRLYLDQLTDILPKGFTFRNLSAAGGYRLATDNPLITTIRGRQNNIQGSPVLITDESRAASQIEYVSAYVSATVEGSKVTFSLSGDPLNRAGFVGYSKYMDRYYLNPGQAIVFCYTCDIARDETKTEDAAENRVFMNVLDPEACGVKIYDKATISSAHLTDLTPNNGGCALTSNGTYKQLVSDVIVRRGKVLPGASKKLISYYDPDQLKTITNLGPNEIVPPMADLNWQITTYNDSDREINGYTLEDTMQYPYRVRGAVTYQLWNANGTRASAPYKGIDSLDENVLPLFHVTDRNEQEHTVRIRDMKGTIHILHTLPQEDGAVETVDLPIVYIRERANGVARSAYESQQNTAGAYVGNVGRTTDAAGKSMHITVSFVLDKEANTETLRIEFPRDVMVHMPNCTGELTVTTARMDMEYQNTSYVNVARFIPDNLDYDAYMVKHGTPLIEDSILTVRNNGVEANGFVTIATGYATIGLKNVSEIMGDPEKPGDTTIRERKADENVYLVKEKDTIVLPPKQNEKFHPVRYTLSVENASSTVDNYLTELVLIDNLPQTGDGYTLRSDIKRHSEYNIRFAEDPDIAVWIHKSADGSSTEKDQYLDDSRYIVEYNERTEFEGSDWSGEGEGWHTEKTLTDRSIRVIIRDTATSAQTALMPGNSIVCMEFNAEVVAEGAEPGMVANNSFAYSYKVGGQSLSASPLMTGVKISTFPFIEKKLVDLHNNAFNAEKDETFRFVIYDGEPVEGLETMTEDQIKTALTGHIYRMESLTVQKDSSVSSRIRLDDNESWTWTKGEQYNIVELAPSREYRLNRWEGFTETFKYDPSVTQVITAENTMKKWDIDLTKVSKKKADLKLSGAVFALYSPNALDAITEEAYTAACETAGMEIEKEFQRENATWYLMAAAETGKDGRINWKGLLEDTYIIRELVAPKGYNLAIEDMVVTHYSISPDNTVAYLTVPNSEAFVISSTGGMGTLPLYLGGWALLLSASAVMLLRRKRRRA